MEEILKVENLSKSFPSGQSSFFAVKGVSFDVREKEFVSIMGPSGSGKTTLLHLVAGLDNPDQGKVYLLGEEIFGLKEGKRTVLRRKHLGFIFQFFNLLPDLTVEENLVLPLLIAGRNPKKERERIEWLMEELGLKDFRKRLPHSLSGGEMQRVSIARALVPGPRLVLADEPTGNLSTGAGEETMKLFRKVKDVFQASVLLVTHNPRDAAFGDRVLFLKDGVIDPGATMKGPGLDAGAVFSRLEELGI